MRKFIKLNEELLKEAKKLLGIKSTSEIVRRALLDRISAEAQNKLATLGGNDPNFGKIIHEAED